MNQMIAWLVYLIFVSFSLVLGDFFGKVAIRFVLYTWLVYLFWRLFITLRRIQRNKIPALANTVGINLDANTDGTARELKK
jgi:hypothetical protein